MCSASTPNYRQTMLLDMDPDNVSQLTLNALMYRSHENGFTSGLFKAVVRFQFFRTVLEY